MLIALTLLNDMSMVKKKGADMEIHSTGRAGTLQSSDCIVWVEPGRREILIDSPVEYAFSSQMRSVIEQVLKEEQVQDVRVRLEDRGALDCTIRARLRAALAEACQ